jgi:hypothetical protein
MSLKDLEELGVLLPKDQWGAYALHSTVSRPALVSAGLLGAMAIVVMYAGNGGTFTFVGAGLFLAFMAWITHISIRAIDRQAGQFQQEHESSGGEPPAEGLAESHVRPAAGDTGTHAQGRRMR